MRALWVVNTPVYIDDEHTTSTRGGWMEGALKAVANELEICITFPIQEKKIEEEDINNISYYYFSYNQFENKKIKYDTKLEENLKHIIEKSTPDIIHIWGTEYLHSLAAVNAARKLGLIDRVVINLQGLVSVYASHYAAGIPSKYMRGNTISERCRGISLKGDIRSLQIKGEYEKQTLLNVKHVIGRTDWDKACALQINKKLQYHFCNETLRRNFYDGNKWEYLNCEKHTLFITQPGHPIKGIHIVLQALALIKKEYPDVILYATGENIFRKSSNSGIVNRVLSILPEKYQKTSYIRFLLSIINKYDLTQNIIFLGELSKEDMYKQFLKTNVFVSASSIENESNAISEAHILGVPIVASYVGGVTNRIRHDMDGFLYPYNEPYMLAYYVCQLFADPPKAEKFSRNGINYANKINDALTNKKQLIEIYNKICGDTL